MRLPRSSFLFQLPSLLCAPLGALGQNARLTRLILVLGLATPVTQAADAAATSPTPATASTTSSTTTSSITTGGSSNAAAGTDSGFAVLTGFNLDEDALKESSPRAGLPTQVLALDGKEVAVRGYMLPLRLEKGRAMEFLLLRDQGACCFGRTPKLNEWVLVKAGAEGVAVQMDIPIVCRGKLSVGGRFDTGVLTGVYFMEQATITAEK